MKYRRPWVVEYRVPDYAGPGVWSGWRLISRCATWEGADRIRWRWENVVLRDNRCEYRIEKRPVVVVPRG